MSTRILKQKGGIAISTDKLLDLVFNELTIWENAINDGADKEIKDYIIKDFSDPHYRDSLKNKIAKHEYHVQPPHEAQIPKDDGTMRTVYANEGRDRILLTVINNVFFKHYSHMIHPQCVSYQIGIGCGKIDKRVINDIQHANLPPDHLGYKIDLSKYFDSVPIEYIDAVFNSIEKQFGSSSILDLVREYYHDDTLLDLNRNPIHKYTSLRQGCAIAAFLADAVLYDIDDTISKMDVIYYRYSDDILILGHNADAAFEKISTMLNERSLTLNPKKVEKLDANHWFTFLGFSIKNTTLTLSKKRIKNLQTEIKKRTFDTKKPTNPKTALRKVYMYLYDNSITKYGYADGILPIINSDADIATLDAFILDCIRACETHKTKIGGLGYCKTKSEGVIVRGKGRHVRTNRTKMPHVENYVPLSYMRTLYNADKNAYNAYVKELILC